MRPSLPVRRLHPTLRLCFAAARAVALAAALAWGAAGVARAEAVPAAKLTYFGQSCFLLESAGGARVLMDPFAKGIGHDLPAGVRANVVTISHEHGDHNNAAAAAGRPRVLRGLTADRKGWTKINDKVKDVSIRTVGVYHDDKRGTLRGPTAVFLFEVGGLRIAHLGDLGHVLDDKQLSAIGAVDVVLVPVGGAFTLDAAEASRVVDQLRPRVVVIPMHYRTPTSTISQLATVEAFVADKTNVRRLDGNVLPLSALKRRPGAEIVVMGYR